MRFLLLWGCVALCILVVASHRDRAESKDVESQGRDPDERRKRTRVNVSTKTKPRVSPRSGAFSALSRKGEVKTARNKRTTAKGSTRTRTRVPKLPGVFSAVARPPRNRRALQNIKPTRKPRPGVYGPLRELSRRDTEDVEKQNKRQKHFKKRGRGDKRRGRKNDDKGFRPQVELSETRRDDDGHRHHRHREHISFRKQASGLYSPLGSSRAGKGDRRHKGDTKVEVPETMRDNRGHHREDKPHKKHRPGVFTSLIKDGKQPDDLKE